MTESEREILKPKDDIDEWLFDNIHVLPGCCSSIENLRYNIAREVAEKLWNNKQK